MDVTMEPAQDSASSNFLEFYFSHFAMRCPIPMARLSEEAAILSANPAFEKLTGRNMGDAAHTSLFNLITPASKDVLQGILNDAFKNGICATVPYSIELLPARAGDNEKLVSASMYITCLDGEAAGKTAVIVHLVDTTEQKNLEVRFAHSQKMQAVGQLAGGVAHDFNNLLTAMIGFCDLLLMRHPAGDPSFADIMQIKQNSNRAANLVRQLLAFSRRQTLQPKVLDMTDVLAELSHLIRRLIGENIKLEMVHGRDIGKVKVDQGQLEQVIINLAVNARDAMAATGGTLTIRTSDMVVSGGHSLPPSLISPVAEDSILSGRYVLVEVVDSGCGIRREMIQQIFEPFFSTKEVGAGTGLGLSTVYGIVKQTGGYIYVSSTPDVGTTFSIFFPRHQDSGVAHVEAPEKHSAADLTGNGTILLVEDETPVRTFSSRALSNKGYTVLEADSAETALGIMKERGNDIQVIISDVIMPGMTGPDMVKEILKTYPNIKVVFISGYAEDAFVNSFGRDREFNFLPKPFTLKQLASKVKEVMES